MQHFDPATASPYGYHERQAPHGSLQPAYPPQSNVARPARAAPGVIAIILSVVAVGPLGLAVFNLEQATRLAVDPELPKWIRAVAVDANMNRVLVFGAAAGACALVALVLGLVGRRATAGKIGLALAGLLFAGTAYAEIGRFAFDAKLPPGNLDADADDARGKAHDSARKDEGALPAPSAEAPVANPRHGAFRLGRQVGLAALGRARGEAAAADRLFARAQQHAKDLGVTLRPLPVLSGDETKDTAEALHYLLDTVGKPVASTLSSKHGPAHAAAFELGIKLNVVNLLYLPEDKLGQGLGITCDKLAQSAGLSPSTMDPLLSKIRANASQDAVGNAALSVGDAIDRELATAPPAPPPAPKKQRPVDLDARLH